MSVAFAIGLALKAMVDAEKLELPLSISGAAFGLTPTDVRQHTACRSFAPALGNSIAGALGPDDQLFYDVSESARVAG